MGAFDISRNAYNPAKHYSSVRMQQGRVMTDDDWNENERIENEERRRLLTDIVGPFGSPNDGFKITNLQWNTGFVNFNIEPGTLYLGGLRLEMDLVPTGGPHRETFRVQRDWLQFAQGELPTPTYGALTAPRYDLVYLEAWQQGLSAIEDNELFEAALAGPDTGTRMRYMRRVHVAPNIGQEECWQAAMALGMQWETAHLGRMNDEMERRVDTTLQVGFTEEGTGDDLCTPAVAGSYLGAENQAIRVQIVDATHFTWGYDNASPYYRVQMIDPTTVQLQDLPKDQYHWPLSGTNVELLAWSALLPNGEKVASRTGFLTKLSGSYDPNTHRVTLSTPLPGGFNSNWSGRPDAAEISNNGADTHLYMRVWHRGTDVVSTASLLIQPGPNVLGNTGLTVTFGGMDRVAGDFWIIAARPETPEEIMPWRLQHGGMGPHGFRRFFAPLAVIRWRREGTTSVRGDIIHDCRKTFRPLTDIESCCTYHVGDGRTSFGDFNSIGEAINSLPHTGGHICVLPGRHNCNIALVGRQNITISGCGDQSLILPHDNQVNLPIFFIANCQNITIEGLAFAARLNRAICLIDAQMITGQVVSPSNTIIIQRNFFTALLNAIYIHTVDTLAGDNNIYIGYNEIAIPNLATAGVGIFCLADGVVIERNKVVVVPAPQETPPQENPGDNGQSGGIFDPCDQPDNLNNDPLVLYVFLMWGYLHNMGGWPRPATYLALGGIQIGSSSERVCLLENKIVGGGSNGITLGHLPSIIDTGQQDTQLAGILDQIHRNAMVSGDLNPQSINPLGLAVLMQHFKSTLYEIQIERNYISDMGLAGVGTLCFFVAPQNQDGLVYIVNDLLLNENQIVKCAQQIPSETRNALRVGYGGVVMAELNEAVIVDNLVRDCGKSSIEPVCGIYIMTGEKFSISRNRILKNGPELDMGELGINLNSQTRLGSRGGIFIAFAIKTDFIDIIASEVISDGLPAAQIHDNIVVQPLGQALFMIAMGPVSVVGNTLTSQDLDFRNVLTLIAGTVFILNLGVSQDMLRRLVEPSLSSLPGNTGITNQIPGTTNAGLNEANLLLLGLQYLPGGNVMFNDNQVLLDQRNLEIDLTLSSCLIATLDDLSFVSNQLECKGLALIGNLQEPQLISVDYAICNALLAGITVRTADNRFQEGWTGTFLSLISLAMINSTTGNQSSHCLFAFGLRRAFANNIENILSNGDCPGYLSNYEFSTGNRKG